MGQLLAGGRRQRGRARGAPPGHAHDRRPLLVPLVVALATVSVASCGGDDGGASAFSVGDGTGTTAPGAPAVTTTVGDGVSADVPDDPGPYTCDTIDENLVRFALEGVGDLTGAAPSGFGGLATTFSRQDGTEFAYVPAGCRYIVTTEGDEEHRVTISSAADPEGVDLYEEMSAVVGDADRQPAEGVGDGAFFDKRLDDQVVTLVARANDRVLFVKSQPPAGAPALDDDTLVLLAEIALLADLAPATGG